MTSNFIWDTAKTGKTKCDSCRNFINLGEFRLIKQTRGGQYAIRTYYCKNHAIVKINDDIQSLLQDRINIKKAMKLKPIKKKKEYKFKNCIDKRGKKNEFNE